QNLLVAHDIPLRALEVRAESAKDAAVDADVGGIDMRIDIVIAEVTVLAFANEVGQLGQGKEIIAGMKEHAVLKGKPLAGLDLLSDGGQLQVDCHSISPSLKRGSRGTSRCGLQSARKSR